MPIDIVDYTVKDSEMYVDTRSGIIKKLKIPSWECMSDRCMKNIFERGGTIVDIGGGMRLDDGRSDRSNQKRMAKFGHYLTKHGVHYKTTDYTDQYKPDFVEDIHQLSFKDDSIDGIFCLAVLEHVYDPKKAAEEIVRVLKKGGEAFIYVPFLYRYHAHQKDYKDYFRYSKDGIAYLFRDCEYILICPLRGIVETLLRFSPLHRFRLCMYAARFLDTFVPRLRRMSNNQTSGYNIMIRK